MMMSSVSPIDNLVGCRKRSRVLVSDWDSYRTRPRGPRQKPIWEFNAGDELSSVRFGYIKGLGLCDDVINEITRNLLAKHKKLHLILDVDHTRLNTTYIDKMSPEEEYLKADHSLQDVHISGSQSQLMTKLRPHVRTFLEQASEMFELSICTTGSGGYALQMANLLDPANQMFGGRIISRSDGTVNKQKGLDVLLARPSAVVVLDDKKQVWRNEDQDNVIEMPRYHFFRSS